MDGVDSNLEEFLAYLLGGHHSGVGGGLLSVARDLHTSGDSAESLSAGNVGDVDEGVVPGGHDVGDSNDRFVFLGDFGSEGFQGFVLFLMDFLVHV